MKKILITGSNGLLGQTLVNLLLKEKENYQVVGFSRGENRSGRDDFLYISIDITDGNQLKKELQKIQPDVIIHTAAMTNVDVCEDDKKGCDILNIDVVKNITDIVTELDCHFIHISTDFIFDGENGFYKETDVPNPLSYYGMSKLKSEKIIVNSNINYTIFRTILVYGFVYKMSRNNIVLWVKKMLSEGKEITIVNDQFRMPTYAEDLALACKMAIDKKVTGIFNISSNTLLSIYEIAQQIAEIFGLDKKLIQPISTVTLGQKAKRPPKTGFNLEKTKTILGFYPKSFKEDLLRFKEKLKQYQ